MPCCVSGILLHINSEILTDDDTLPNLPCEVKNLDKPQDQKSVDKDTSIMISSSEQDDSSPLKPTSPVAGPSAPQPMGSSSPRPFETGLMNKTSSSKLDMPKLGKRYVFCDLIILSYIFQLTQSIPYHCVPFELSYNFTINKIYSLLLHAFNI